MLKSRFFIVAFVLLVIVALLHFAGIEYELYFKIHWIDKLIHFLAGLCLGFAFLYSIEGWLSFSNVSIIKLFIGGAVFVLLVGIVWEIFEYSFDLTFTWLSSYPFDTFTDIVADFFGGLIGLAFLYKNEK